MEHGGSSFAGINTCHYLDEAVPDGALAFVHSCVIGGRTADREAREHIVGGMRGRRKGLWRECDLDWLESA